MQKEKDEFFYKGLNSLFEASLRQTQTLLWKSDLD